MKVTSNGVIFFMPLGGDGREEAGVNDSPVGCQSRLTEAASSRKKEPYRPHQAKPELVARLKVTSNGVTFLCIWNFAQIPITGARCAPACTPSVTAVPCRRGVQAFYAVKRRNPNPSPTGMKFGFLGFGGVSPSKSELSADAISSSEIVCVPC